MIGSCSYTACAAVASWPQDIVSFFIHSAVVSSLLVLWLTIQYISCCVGSLPWVWSSHGHRIVFGSCALELFLLWLTPVPRDSGWFLHLVLRLVPTPGATVGSCTWCLGWFLHLVIRRFLQLVPLLVPAPGAAVGSCTWCCGRFLHLVLRLVPAAGAAVGSCTWTFVCS